MSFKSGFITGQSVSRRAGSSGGFGGSALSLMAVTQKSRSVIRPAPGGGGGSSDPFKTVLRTIATPAMEFVFATSSAAGGVGGRNVNDTGTRNRDIDSVNNGITASSDSNGGFEGYFAVAENDEYMRFGFGSSYKHMINRSTPRSWIFVFDVTGTLPANSGYLNLGSTATDKNAWGWVSVGSYGTNASGSVFNSRYFFNPNPTGVHAAWSTPLTEGNASHHGGGTPTSMVTATGSEGASRRSILMFTYDTDGNEAFVRWKQSGDASGHSYIEGVTTPQTANWTASTYFAGYNVTGQNAAVGTKWKYIAVVDQVLGADDFDTIAAAAGL